VWQKLLAMPLEFPADGSVGIPTIDLAADPEPVVTEGG
jgi:hypothetical protein